MGGEWKQHAVSDLIERGALIIGDGYRAKNEELSSFGLPFARAGNINDGFRFDAADHFPEGNIERVGNKVSQPGDVVFTSKGTVGRFAFVRPATPRFVYSPQLCFWRSLDPELIDPRFLFFWMTGREFFVQFKGVAGQTDMAEYVSLADQRRMHITLPPLPAQRAIAHILGTLDDKIELNRKQNETLEAMARALFKAWFVDFEPVRAKIEGRWQRGQSLPGLPAHLYDLFPDRLVESELGEIPEGWEVRSLDSIANYLNGLALHKFPPESDDEFLPVIKIAQLRAGNTDGADRASARIKPEYVVVDGDVLFSWSGSLEVVIWCGGRGALNQHLFKITSNEVPKWFYYYATLHHLPEFRAIAAGKATTMGHIQRKHLKDARIAVAPLSDMKNFDAFISPLFDQMVNIAQQSRSLAQLRDTLLPKLISGELRVKHAERIVESAV
jgi:type I restriction enzyme S subunit